MAEDIHSTVQLIPDALLENSIKLNFELSSSDYTVLNSSHLPQTSQKKLDSSSLEV